MRIAYISLHWIRTRNSGVGKKIEQTLRLWREEGHEAAFFMHTHPFPGSDELVEGERYIYREGQGVPGLLQREISRSQALRRLIGGVAAFQPDVIFLRWGMYAFPLHTLANIAPVAIEINTNDAQQHRLLGKVYGYYNLLTRSLLLRRAAGLMCVSHELAEAPEFARFGKPVAVISNGYDLEKVQPLPAPQNGTPRLVFIGTPGYAWHGVDKLARFARTYPHLQVDVAGYDALPDGSAAPDNLHLHGYLSGEAYLRVLGGADAAFGTLALHRKEMEEASPLKTRECLAYGLPMILPYRDTELDDLDACPFILKIPNREDNLQTHGKAVGEFAERMRGVRVERAAIAPRIDARCKEKERLEFFRRLVGRA